MTPEREQLIRNTWKYRKHGFTGGNMSVTLAGYPPFNRALDLSREPALPHSCDLTVERLTYTRGFRHDDVLNRTDRWVECEGVVVDGTKPANAFAR